MDVLQLSVESILIACDGIIIFARFHGDID